MASSTDTFGNTMGSVPRPTTFADANQTKATTMHQVSSSVDSGTTDLSLIDSTSYVKAPPVDGFLAAAQQSSFHTFLPQGKFNNNGEWNCKSA